MAQVTGRPTPAGGLTFRSGIAAVDTKQHALHNVSPRTVRPYNYSPLGPSTLHVSSPLKPNKVK
jgi:hypothetical protein